MFLFWASILYSQVDMKERASMSLKRHKAGYGWAISGVTLATACFWLVHSSLDKGQASLLYLPVVLACAVRFGFGPAVLGAILSFLCWDFFFLPPFFTFAVADPKDWLSLAIFLLAAVVTARLAAQARTQTQQARARESEIATLFQASEALSREVGADRLLTALAEQLRFLCHATRCLVLRRVGDAFCPAPESGRVSHGEEEPSYLLRLAEVAFAGDQVIGFGTSRHLWAKALSEMEAPHLAPSVSAMGVYVPLRAAETLVGVLHVGPRDDGLFYSGLEERLILTLANHAAVVIARDRLAEQAAQAAALREADALKDSLLSLVSHELRTPLATIKASVTGLLAPHAVLDESARVENLRAVDRETDRLSAVVGNLLDLSRLEAGVWQPHKDWCDLGEIIATVLDQLSEEQAGRIKVNLASDLPLLRADYTQIVLVLANLLENAIKYAPAESSILLSAASVSNGQDESPESVMLAVRDFGPGIAAGDEERLFERFYRAKAHQNSAMHGTGLGLALCRIIVRAHGGRIWAGNAPAGEPRGAIFSVSLPIDSLS